MEINLSRESSCGRYKNVCIVLNDDIDNELCTDSRTGFTGDEDLLPFITWTKPTNNVKKVELVFREEDDYYGHAQISDLKILYNNIDYLTVTGNNFSDNFYLPKLGFVQFL